MERVVYFKFKQHDELRELLLLTDDSNLIEHTSNDNYWADGGDGRDYIWTFRFLVFLRIGSGQNHLGKILEKIRDILKQEQQTQVSK